MLSFAVWRVECVITFFIDWSTFVHYLFLIGFYLFVGTLPTLLIFDSSSVVIEGTLCCSYAVACVSRFCGVRCLRSFFDWWSVTCERAERLSILWWATMLIMALDDRACGDTLDWWLNRSCTVLYFDRSYHATDGIDVPIVQALVFRVFSIKFSG